MTAKPDRGTRERILLVGPNWFGDALFLTPAIRAIRRRFPHAMLAVLAPTRVRQVLAANPHLDEIIVYNDRAGLLNIFHTIGLLMRLRAARFDSAFLFHRSKTKAVYTCLAGIGHRVGYNTGTFLRRQFLTHIFEHPESCGRTIHRIDLYLRLVQNMGIEPDGRWTEYLTSQTDKDAMAALLKDAGIELNGGYIVAHIGANWPLKRWPPEHFARWAVLLRQKLRQPVIFCGTAKETALVRRVMELAGMEGLYDFTAKTSIGELAALLQSAVMFLSNDSGPLHLAAAVGVPTVAIFGPTSPVITAPIGRKQARVLWKDVGCRVPCYFRACDYRVCMRCISPQEAVDACLEVMRASAGA